MATRSLKIFSVASADEAFAKLKLAKKQKAEPSQAGIVHPAGHEGALVERSAVARALQEKTRELGVPYQSGPAGDLHKDVEKYTAALRKIANSKAAEHPAVQSYIQTARRLVAPAEAGKDAAGREQLSNTQVQPSVADLAGLLHKRGLLEVADRLLAKDPEHVPFENYAAKLKTKPPVKSGFVDLTGRGTNHEPTPQELSQHLGQLAPTIPPATDETVTAPEGHYMSVRKANRDRDAMESDTPLSLDDETSPLSLASVPEDEVISSALLGPNKLPMGEAVAKVAAAHKVSPSTARRKIKAWIEGQRSAVKATGPEKLARKGQYDPTAKVQPADMHGGVDPHIAGTRLAMHLIQLAKEFAPGTQGAASTEHGTSIHALAKAALAGKGAKGAGGDVYGKLGDALKAVGHPHGETYNWRTMGRSMSDDAVVNDFLKKYRKAGMTDREFYSKVVSTYAPGSKHAGSTHHDQFWKMLEDHFGASAHGMTERGHPGQVSTEKRARLVDSLYRLHTLADDRETLANMNTRASKNATTDGQGMGLGDWRKHFSQTWATEGDEGNKHMRFDRRKVHAKMKLQRPEEYNHITKSIAENRGEVTGRKALADFLQENGIPGAHIVNHNEIPHQDDEVDGRSARNYLAGVSSHNGLWSSADRTHIMALNDHGHWWGNPESAEAEAPNIPEHLNARRSAAETPAAFEKEVGDVPYAQMSFPEKGRKGKLALYTLHANPHGQRLFHAVTVESAEKLKQMTADWPAAAKEKLLAEIKRNNLTRFFKRRGGKTPKA